MNNNDYFEYEEEKKKFPWKRLLISLLILIAIVIIILLLIKGCGGSKLDKTLLQAGKDYYTKYPDKLPTEAGECYNVDLNTLTSENLIKNTNSFKTCDNSETYVKVCLLESKAYHYVAVLSCDNEKSEFGIWSDGLESDIIADVSDVRFKFQGEELSTGTKYYYPSNATDASTVKEYYKSSPADLYTGKDNEATGYKWYTQGGGKEYWNNGEYSSTQPSGYPNKGASTTKTTTSTELPASASYRTITGGQTLYSKQIVAHEYIWWCYNGVDENSIIKSSSPCGGDFPKLVYAEYTCNGSTTVSKTTPIVCSDWTSYSTDVCTESVANGVKCKTKIGDYTYTDTMWKWYKDVSGNAYYPSGSSTASGENTYYTSAPVSGALKDDSTATTVYKFYKLEKDGNNNNYEEWMPITNGYVDQNEMINKFKDLGYDVSTLKDINSLDNIRYELQLQYRNPVE